MLAAGAAAETPACAGAVDGAVAAAWSEPAPCVFRCVWLFEAWSVLRSGSGATALASVGAVPALLSLVSRDGTAAAQAAAGAASGADGPVGPREGFGLFGLASFWGLVVVLDVCGSAVCCMDTR